MADAVRLEITVDDKGSPVIKAVTDKLSDMGKQAGSAAGGQVKLNDAATKGTAVLNDLGANVGGVVGRIAGAIGPVGLLAGTIGAGLVAATTHAINEFSRFAFQVRDLSFLSGGSAKDVAGLVTAMEDLGVESGTVEQGINRMSQAVATGDPTILKLVGSFRTQSGALKDGLTLYYETIDALGRMTNQVERNRAAQEIFGRGWTAMVPVIQKGSAAIKAMGEENAATGKTMSEGGIRAAEDYRRATNDLKDVMEGLTTIWGSRLIPIVTKFAELLTPSTTATRFYVNEIGLLEVAVDDAADAYAKLDGEQRRFLAGSQNAPQHVRGTPAGPPTLMDWEIEAAKKHAADLAEIRAKNDYESLKAQKAMLDEAEELGAKFLLDEQKRDDASTEARIKNDYESLKAQKAMLDEAEELGAKFLLDEQKRKDEAAQDDLERTQKLSDAEIKYWVANVDQQMALDEQLARYQSALQQDAARTREEAWRRSFWNMRGITEDAFAGVNNAISTSIKGIIQGTQTMEDAFKRMGESVALGLVDSIVNRGLKAIENALLDSVFGGSGGGGLNWLSMLGGVSSMAGGIWDAGSSALSGLGSFLGFLNKGMWSVPDLSGQEWAVLHPGEMVLPPDVAAAVRAAGGLRNTDGGMIWAPALAGLYSGGSGGLSYGGTGSGGAGASPGGYGAMTAAQRDTLGTLGWGAKFGGTALGLLGGPNPLSALSTMISAILGFDAIRGWLGLDPTIGFVSPTEADYQSIRDTYGYDSVQETAARTAAAIEQSLRDMNSPGWSGDNPDQNAGLSDRESGADTGVYAAGVLFTTSGRRKMVVGEAGTETVAVLRNPREVDVGGAAPAIHVHFDLRGSVVGDAHLPDNVARTISRDLERLWNLRRAVR